MNNINMLLSGVLLTSGILMVVMAINLLKVKELPLAITSFFLCLAVAFYSIGYSMELISHSLQNMLASNYIQYIGLPFMPALWIEFTLKYTGSPMASRRKILILLFLVPVLTILFRFTNDLHHLFYTSASISTQGLFPVMLTEKGPVYLLFVSYIGFAVFYSNLLFYKKYTHSTGDVRRQCLTLFIASILPWFSTIQNTVGFTLFGLDTGPFTVTISAGIFVFNIIQNKILYLKPIARERFFELTSDGIIVLDNDFIIDDMNAAAKIILGSMGIETALNRRVWDVFSRGVEAIKWDKIGVDNQISFYDVTGEDKHYNLRTELVMDRSSEIIGYLVLITDITKHISRYEEIKLIASKDSLTGIFNRKSFVDICEKILYESNISGLPISLLLLDIDRFKGINDNYGHQVGDDVIKKIVEIGSRSIRKNDVFGRYGGEEFVIMLQVADKRKCMEIAERIRKNVESEIIEFEDKKIRTTVSIGITHRKSITDESIDQLIREADLSLYRAKKNGRNRIEIFVEEAVSN